MNPYRCPSCDLLDDWIENPVMPYCSEVCRLLWRHGIAWRIDPCKIVVGIHPHLILQKGPRFNLSESALKGSATRLLATERKRRQRAGQCLSDVTPTAQYKLSTGTPYVILGRENVAEGLGSGK